MRPQVTGASPSSPLQDFKLQGIGLRDTAPTMLEPHGVPSGGDWALERIGSIFLQNTVSHMTACCTMCCWNVWSNAARHRATISGHHMCLLEEGWAAYS